MWQYQYIFFILLSLYLFKICLQGQFLWEKISLRQIITKIVGFLQTGKYVICWTIYDSRWYPDLESIQYIARMY